MTDGLGRRRAPARVRAASLASAGAAAAVLCLSALTCTKTPAKGRAPATSSCGMENGNMASDEIKIGETTRVTLSGHRVGVSNIWERDLPDEGGKVAPRMSATLSVTEVATGKETPDFKVFAGSVVTLGADRYCVVRVEEGVDDPGDIYLRKLAP